MSFIPKRLLSCCQARPEDAKLVVLVVDKTNRRNSNRRMCRNIARGMAMPPEARLDGNEIAFALEALLAFVPCNDHSCVGVGTGGEATDA